MPLMKAVIRVGSRTKGGNLHDTCHLPGPSPMAAKAD